MFLPSLLGLCSYTSFFASIFLFLQLSLTGAEPEIRNGGAVLGAGASPAGGQGGYALPIFVFAPSVFFLPPHGIFWEEEVGVFGRKKR